MSETKEERGGVGNGDGWEGVSGSGNKVAVASMFGCSSRSCTLLELEEDGEDVNVMMTNTPVVLLSSNTNKETRE